MHIVKQICVVNNTLANDFNKPYIKLLSVDANNGYSAKVEVDVKKKDGITKREDKTVKNN